MTTMSFAPSALTPLPGFLLWREGPKARQVELGPFLTIGRECANHVVIEDNFVSTRHARVEKRPDGFLLRDLRSRNGTYVNGTRVFEALLREGDVLRIGAAELTFSYHRTGLKRAPSLSSKNPAWAAQIQRLPSIAESPFPVLLMGASGAGKDVIAQNLHQLSNRAEGPFVSVNCSSLSESLVESELFGHMRGSFTGATHDRKGAFESARRGTLFLDEVGDLPLALQPKLLRALENNQIRPVGSDRSVQTDVRLVAATHRDLRKMARSGSFRPDLLFRLNVIQIQAPSLIDRIEDFEDLFYSFAREHRVRFSFAAIQRLKTHSWPGNIRELRNVVARAKAHYGGEEVGEMQAVALLDDGVQWHRPTDLPQPTEKRSLIKEMEVEMIKSSLVANHGNQRRAAHDLGIAKSTLYDRIRKFGIDVDELLGRTAQR